MAKAHEIGSSSIKKCLLMAYQHGFPNHFKNNVGPRWKGLTETNSGIIYSFVYVG